MTIKESVMAGIIPENLRILKFLMKHLRKHRRSLLKKGRGGVILHNQCEIFFKVILYLFAIILNL